MVVGDEVLGLGVRAEGAHEDEAADPGVARGRDEVAGALLHEPLEVAPLARADGDEVDHAVAALDGMAQARGVRHVALDELAAPAREPGGLPPIADEAPDLPALGPQRVHDPRPDEAGAAGDEDGHAASSPSKFCQ